MEISLQNNFLIAMPSIQQTIFHKSVVYICEHNTNGAMGIIINKAFKKIKIKHILKKLNIETSYYTFGPILHDAVMIGGPIAQDRGIVIHAIKKKFYSSLKITKNTIITTSKDILESLGMIQKTNNILLFLGYCIWDKNQLENELLHNVWLTIPATHNVLFHTTPKKKWNKVNKKLGIPLYQLSSHHVYL
ncbi:UPF0301 protein YqgE [Buchnera aphidicola (Pterocallis alni)]|uniref:YqgE/AlgH family protein n=1 Tax=Buchnera aphidicola TaxID=9 RepID=UPI0034646627